jgi:hypothetical protein
MATQRQFGFDINNPGAGGTRGSVEIPSSYFDAVIEDIIINENNGEILTYNPDGSNIGQAIVRIIPDDWGLDKNQLKSAFPLDMNMQEFPLVGEQVTIFKAFGSLFYTKKISTKRRLTENLSSIIPQTFGANAGKTTEVKDSRQLSAQGVPTNTTGTTIDRSGGGFISNFNVRPLRSNVGDVILSGRFGNFIRMGSSLFIDPNATLPEPNILLTAGTWDTPKQLSTGNTITPHSLAYENINNDKSSIWMVANQRIPFIASTALGDREDKAHLLSSENRTVSYTGAQIFINSDRIILNTKRNEISLFSNAELNLSALKSITLDTERSAYIRAFRDVNIKADDTISLEAKQIAVASLEDLAFKTTGNYSIVGKNVFIGKHGDISEPMVLGASLSVFLQRLITIISANINAGVVVTPTGPGTVTFPSLVASLELLSNSALGGPVPQLAVFNSRNNFTSETNSV